MGENLSDKELEQKALQDAIAFYNKHKGKAPEENGDTIAQTQSHIPESIKMPQLENKYRSEAVEKEMMTENDPDLVMTYEIVPLPSKGLFYENGLKEVKIEYLTSRDEDLLTTPSFIEDGSVLDRLLERKIVDKNVNPKNLLSGDRSALILFLRTSSYGDYYKVSVSDPRNGKKIEAEVNLRKLKYKEVSEKPDEKGEFSIEIPNRKKIVKFKLLTSGQEDQVLKNAEARKEAYALEYSEFNTMRLKASITEIGGNRDRSYIDRFVDVMPAGDAYAIRRKILDVSPDIDMMYEFTASDGYKFDAQLSLGIDFFFPSR